MLRNYASLCIDATREQQLQARVAPRISQVIQFRHNEVDGKDARVWTAVISSQRWFSWGIVRDLPFPVPG
jgi:hypothetical protein